MPQIENTFPKLRYSKYTITSPVDDGYNCIAWAAGDVTRFWWPLDDPRYHWPRKIPTRITLDEFVLMFSERGYEQCNTDAHEENVEKVALFANESLKPTHAARQLENGRWTNKLGSGQDIEHELHGLEGAFYGHVHFILKRPIQQ